jgi:hypothetical protein
MIAAICAVVAPATINAQYDGTYAGYNGYASQNPSASIEDTLFAGEPTVEEAIDEAMDHFGLGTDRIASLRRRANLSALLPQVEAATRSNSSDLTLDRFDFVTLPDQIAAQDLGEGSVTEYQISAGWDLSQLAFNPSSLDINSMVTLHQDLAEEVISAYFLRRRLMLSLAMNPPDDPVTRASLEMRLQQATATLNALTGDLFD